MINLAYAGLVRVNDALLATGDVTGYIISIYTDVMGDMFLGSIMLVLFGGLYIRTQSLIYPAIIWIVVGGALEIAVPTGAMSIGKGFIIIAVGVTIYQLFMGNRN